MKEGVSDFLQYYEGEIRQILIQCNAKISYSSAGGQGNAVQSYFIT